VFVRDEVLVHVSFAAAQARLASLARGGSLLHAAKDAYGDGTTGLAGTAPADSVRGMSRLVGVHVHDLRARRDSAYLPLRWEATGAGRESFPALDADITLTPTLTPALEQATRLTLAGVYRPSLGSLDAGLDRVILHRVADATIRAFVLDVAEAMVRPAGEAGPDSGVAGQRSSWLPSASETP
jgi:hypothetical protein